MRIFKLGLGSMAEAAHIVVSAIQADKPGSAEAAIQPAGAPLGPSTDLSLLKLQINVSGRRRPLRSTPPQEQA